MGRATAGAIVASLVGAVHALGVTRILAQRTGLQATAGTATAAQPPTQGHRRAHLLEVCLRRRPARSPQRHTKPGTQCRITAAPAITPA